MCTIKLPCAESLLPIETIFEPGMNSTYIGCLGSGAHHNGEMMGALKGGHV